MRRAAWSAASYPPIAADWVCDAGRECPPTAGLAIPVAPAVEVVVRARVRLAEPRDVIDPAPTLRVWVEHRGEALPASEEEIVAVEDLLFGTSHVRIPEWITRRVGWAKLHAEVRDRGAVLERNEWELYVVFGAPHAPWRPDGHLHRPWIRALRCALRWANGAEAPETALSALQQELWGGLGRPLRAPISVLYQGVEAKAPERSWTLLRLLEEVDEPDGPSLPLVFGCEDAAAFLAFFASILGIECALGAVARTTGIPDNVQANPHRRLGEGGAPPARRHYTYHRVVLHAGNVWDPAFRFEVDGKVVPTENVPQEAYRARFATAETLATTRVQVSGVPEWAFSEDLPIYPEESWPLPPGEPAPPRFGDPRGVLATWFGLRGEKPRISVGQGLSVRGGIARRSLHIAVVAEDDRSMTRLDLFDYASPPAHPKAARVAHARAEQLRVLCAAWLGERTVERALWSGRVVTSDGLATDALLVDLAGYVALVRGVGGRMIPQNPAADALHLQAAQLGEPEAAFLAEDERTRAPLPAFAALVGRLVAAQALDAFPDPTTFFAVPAGP